MRLFFTLYILSIFTREMYMIGMHIIFLLTNSVNKALSICCSHLCFHSFTRDRFKGSNSGCTGRPRRSYWLPAVSHQGATARLLPDGGLSHPFKNKTQAFIFHCLNCRFFIKIENSWLNICAENFYILVNVKKKK